MWYAFGRKHSRKKKIICFYAFCTSFGNLNRLTAIKRIRIVNFTVRIATKNRAHTHMYMNACILVTQSFGLVLPQISFSLSQFGFGFATVHWRNNSLLKCVAISANVMYSFARCCYFFLMLVYVVNLLLCHIRWEIERLKRTVIELYIWMYIILYIDLNRYTK